MNAGQAPNAESVSELRLEAWLQIEDPGLTVPAAVTELRRLGNTIVEVDSAGRRILVARTSVTPNEDGSWPFPAQA